MAVTYNTSPVTSAASLLTYTSPSVKLTLGPSGTYRYQAHNLFLNSAAPADQSVTVVSGATYAVILTGTVTTTLSGAATGTITAGTTNITAATGTLTFGSTSGSGTVQVTRTPADLTYLATAGTARYDLPYEWNTSASPLGIRVEPAATNLLLSSTAIGNSDWISSPATVTLNYAAAPNALTQASRLVDGAGLNVYQIITGAASAFTFSVWVKQDAAATIDIYIYDFNAGAFAALSTLTFSTGVVTNSVGALGRVVETAPGGWFRFAVTGNGTAVANLSGGIYTGTSVLAWGAQLETGSTASSPIETFGSTVTRAVDNIYLATSGFPYSNTEFTVVVEASSAANANAIAVALNSNGAFMSGPSAFARILTTTQVGGGGHSTSVVATVSPPLASNERVKWAVAFNDTTNAERTSVRGGAVQGDTSLDWTGGSNRLQIGALDAAGLLSLDGYINSIVYLPRMVSDAELQTLTT
jgi:hypothetical protein